MTIYSDPAAANLNKGFDVAINIVAKDGQANTVADILQRLIAPTIAETGVKFFIPYCSPTDPSAFFVYELYENEAGWEAHNNSFHFLEAVKELVPVVNVRERVPFVPYLS